MTKEELNELRPYMTSYDYYKADKMLDFITKLTSPEAVATFEGILDDCYFAPAKAKKAVAEAVQAAKDATRLDAQLLRTATELETEVSAIEAEAVVPTTDGPFAWVRRLLKALGF